MRTQKNQPRRAAPAAFIGTTVEFYDFYIYATAAALILGQVFFPNDNPTLNTLAAFGTFAVGFIARPMAGMVFRHLGDRLGRKKNAAVHDDADGDCDHRHWPAPQLRQCRYLGAYRTDRSADYPGYFGRW